MTYTHTSETKAKSRSSSRKEKIFFPLAASSLTKGEKQHLNKKRNPRGVFGKLLTQLSQSKRKQSQPGSRYYWLHHFRPTHFNQFVLLVCDVSWPWSLNAQQTTATPKNPPWCWPEEFGLFVGRSLSKLLNRKKYKTNRAWIRLRW